MELRTMLSRRDMQAKASITPPRGECTGTSTSSRLWEQRLRRLVSAERVPTPKVQTSGVLLLRVEGGRFALQGGGIGTENASCEHSGGEVRLSAERIEE